MESIQAFLRSGRTADRIIYRSRLRYTESGAVFGKRNGPEAPEIEIWGEDRILGCGCRYAADLTVRNAGRGEGGSKREARNIQTGRRVCIQHDPQRAGGRSGRKLSGHDGNLPAIWRI